MKICFKRTNFGAAVLASVLCLIIQLCILGCRHGGELHFDSLFFFMHYLDDRSLLQKIFDPARNDWGFYQARELSYFFDWIDTHFVAFLLKKHIVWFHSICSLLLCGGMVFIQHYFTRKFFPKIPGMLVTLFSVFFVLSEAVTGLDYFRCAKYLTAFGLWGALFAAWGTFRYGDKKSKAALCASLLLMTLSDRQGFFFTAAFAGSAAVLMFYFNWKHTLLSACRMGFPVFAAFGMTCFGILNNLFITPALVRLFNGYTPDFSYQRDFSISTASVGQGGLFFFGNAGNWFSSFTGDIRIAAVTGGLLCAGLLLFFCVRHRKGERRVLPLGLLWGCCIGMMILCASAMVARHSLIMLPDVVYGTYGINFFSLVLFLLTLTAASGNKNFCRIVLVLVAAGIVLRLGGEYCGDRFAPEESSFSGYNSRQSILKETLRDPRFDEKKYCMPHRMELFLQFYRKNILTKP